MHDKIYEAYLLSLALQKFTVVGFAKVFAVAFTRGLQQLFSVLLRSLLPIASAATGVSAKITKSAKKFTRPEINSPD